MGNQNSTRQNEKNGFNLKGKKRKVIIICIAAFLLLGFAARGVGVRNATGWGHRGLANRSHLFMEFIGSGNTAVMSNNFESLGIVFAETNANRRDGHGVTHEALMREAAQMGADAIINVNISPTGGFFTRAWSGSALAIKYLN
jgi:hypothetical protein